MKLIKVRSDWICMGSNPMAGILIKGGKFGPTHRGESPVKREAETECQHHQLREARKDCFLRAFGERMALQTP